MSLEHQQFLVRHALLWLILFAPTPADSCAAPTPVVEFVDPTQTFPFAAPVPVAEFVDPTLAVTYAASALALQVVDHFPDVALGDTGFDSSGFLCTRRCGVIRIGDRGNANKNRVDTPLFPQAWWETCTFSSLSRPMTSPYSHRKSMSCLMNPYSRIS